MQTPPSLERGHFITQGKPGLSRQTSVCGIQSSFDCCLKVSNLNICPLDAPFPWPGTEVLMPSLLAWEAGGREKEGTLNLVFFLLGLDKGEKKISWRPSGIKRRKCLQSKFWNSALQMASQTQECYLGLKRGCVADMGKPWNLGCGKSQVFSSQLWNSYSPGASSWPWGVMGLYNPISSVGIDLPPGHEKPHHSNNPSSVCFCWAGGALWSWGVHPMFGALLK